MMVVGVVLMFLVIVPIALGIVDVVGPAVAIIGTVVLFGSGCFLVSTAVSNDCKDHGGVTVEHGICFTEDGRRVG
jgi:hypothetical protein